MANVPRQVGRVLLFVAACALGWVLGAGLGFLIGASVDFVFPPSTPLGATARPLVPLGGIIGAAIAAIWLERRPGRRSN